MSRVDLWAGSGASEKPCHKKKVTGTRGRAPTVVICPPNLSTHMRVCAHTHNAHTHTEIISTSLVLNTGILTAGPFGWRVKTCVFLLSLFCALQVFYNEHSIFILFFFFLAFNALKKKRKIQYFFSSWFWHIVPWKRRKTKRLKQARARVRAPGPGKGMLLGCFCSQTPGQYSRAKSRGDRHWERARPVSTGTVDLDAMSEVFWKSWSSWASMFVTAGDRRSK